MHQVSSEEGPKESNKSFFLPPRPVVLRSEQTAEVSNLV